MNSSFEDLLNRYPILQVCLRDIEAAFTLLCDTFESGRKLMVCGNGGSASDAEHIVGELMKGFLLPRPLPGAARQRLHEIAGEDIGACLQGALPAVSLTGHPALSTAVANDIRADLVFAQQVYGLGQAGDALLGISTSGNSSNVVHAFHVAKLVGVSTIAMTGRSGGILATQAQVSICVPADTTPEIQELHLPIYHALCIALESLFFGKVVDSGTL
jgi:phosphoheptose isomerase